MYSFLHDLAFSLSHAATCLTFENESAMKKEDTKWLKGRDIWWQVIIQCHLLSKLLAYFRLYQTFWLFWQSFDGHKHAFCWTIFLLVSQVAHLAYGSFQDVVPKCSTTCDVEWVDAEDPLFLLYTSGSTGKPKVFKKSYKRLKYSFFLICG